MSEGFVSLIGDDASPIPVKILMDTGASQSLLLEGILPLSDRSFSGDSVLLQGIELGFVSVPLHNICLKSDLVTGPVLVGVRHELPFTGVTLLLGNDLAGDKVRADPIVCEVPLDEEAIPVNPCTFPVCAVTRSMSKQSDEVVLGDTFLASELSGIPPVDTLIPKDSTGNKPSVSTLTREQLIAEQVSDPDIFELAKNAISEDDFASVRVCCFEKHGVLMRKWQPLDAASNEDWRMLTQIVIPKPYRKEILSLAHDGPLGGHLGINKTYQKILDHFYWPKLKYDVIQYCQTCHSCQVVGKPNQKNPCCTPKTYLSFWRTVQPNPY